MIDLLLELTPDGFEVEESSGLFQLTNGIQTAFLLSIAGGNVDDSGAEATDRAQYWANLSKDSEEEKLRSETLYLLNRIPATTGNVGLIADAVNRDAGWLLSGGYVSDMTTTAVLVSPRRIRIVVETPEGSISVSAPWLG